MNKLLTLLPLVLLLAIPGVSFSSATGYIVELIIYEDLQGRYAHSEDWRFNDKLLHAQKGLKGRPSRDDPQFAELDWRKGKLAKKLKRILKSSQYNVLVNKRWKQTGLGRNKIISIPINTGPASHGEPDESAEKEAPHLHGAVTVTDSSVNSTQDTAALTSGEANSEHPGSDNMGSALDTPEMKPYVTGQVSLIMSRYLHFNVDLHYFKARQTETGGKKYVSYPVFSERRMKSKEVHYIDHPMVGVIVLATPYKIKQRTDEHKTTAYTTHTH
ncbi:hypothetical protein MNBD_GAMMA11-1140 [hydrothermal vent metagenome]|uniref:Uncharacterized protein n=1 Tax=hydrothermal vent metagenome TaxID=652676 RepID=A0A3B0XJJ0_9ZZZZ